MRKLLWLFMFALPMAAQVSNPQIKIVSVDPAGSVSCKFPWQWNALGSGNVWYPGQPSAGSCTWTQLGSGGGGGSPGGSDTNEQFNNSGAFGGEALGNYNLNAASLAGFTPYNGGGASKCMGLTAAECTYYYSTIAPALIGGFDGSDTGGDQIFGGPNWGGQVFWVTQTGANAGNGARTYRLTSNGTPLVPTALTSGGMDFVDFWDDLYLGYASNGSSNYWANGEMDVRVLDSNFLGTVPASTYIPHLQSSIGADMYGFVMPWDYAETHNGLDATIWSPSRSTLTVNDSAVNIVRCGDLAESFTTCGFGGGERVPLFTVSPLGNAAAPQITATGTLTPTVAPTPTPSTTGGALNTNSTAYYFQTVNVQSSTGALTEPSPEGTATTASNCSSLTTCSISIAFTVAAAPDDETTYIYVATSSGAEATDCFKATAAPFVMQNTTFATCPSLPIVNRTSLVTATNIDLPGLDGTGATHHIWADQNGLNNECDATGVTGPGQRFIQYLSTAVGQLTIIDCFNGAMTTVSGTIPDDGAGNGIWVGTLTAVGYQETLTTPSSSSAACTAGQFTDDADYHYVCVATNTWKRALLTTF